MYWDLVGANVIDCVLKILNTGVMPCGVNETNICLIPKTKAPCKITEYRSISLCNVIYKIVSKVLANRLKRILAEVIDESQSAFVPGRIITDNVLVAFETMHCIDGRKKGKEALMALKLDMSKAYDKVEWLFLDMIMRKLGFHEKWISLMLMCITAISYSVLINGEAKGNIIPSRGLRQGDPLSPYLFLLCTEGLSARLRKEEIEGNIRGVSVRKGAPQIFHLFFADDSIIFCIAIVDEGKRVLKVLKEYEAESRQKLNKEKTSLFFSKNTNRGVQVEVKQLFGAQIIQHHEKYLGLPPLVGKGKRKAFSRIKDQVGRKITGWKGEDAGLDYVGKALSPKEKGGMGFRDFKTFILALRAKQGWRIKQNPNTLVHRVLKAKYFANTTFKEAQIGCRPSYVWRSLVAAKDIVVCGARWVVGNRENVKIWEDRWIPTPDSFMVVSPKTPLESEMVACLIDKETGSWDIDKVKGVFLPHEAEAILGMTISSRPVKDSVIWAWTTNGNFSMKGAYWVAQKWLKDQNHKADKGSTSDNTRMRSLWRLVWSLNCPNKMKQFMWRSCRNILPTKHRLKSRGVDIEVGCDFCGICESVEHVLWGCKFTAEVWGESRLKLPLIPYPTEEFLEVVWEIRDRKPDID
ncbi:uncharacterized protein LOC136061642 [Quercus suber]|uniref:uncharacterized protein LOC136061642 n=1 Tax=Quercus suber TaxID=58331 RepID=UPI0032DEF943